jgi:NAD(P)-dependent dehydrogenase (short-subunit alcohol dehydrogenase family)
MRLNGRHILITGAASGMGREIAQLFSAEGATLALLDRNEDGVRDVARGIGARAYRCDVGLPVEVQDTVQTAIRDLTRLDGIVNAAGVLVMKPIEELSPESWNQMLAVNLGGPYHLIRAALPTLRQAEQATVVNIASVSAFLPLPGSSGYSASKAGLVMFTKCLALELGPSIRCNAVCPGTIQTEMTRYIWENPEHAKRASERAALKRMGTANEIAQAALYLTSAESGFTTGTQITVDGGFCWH